VATLAPELKVIAPVRGWQMGREEEIAYAREHGIPIKGGAEQTPYSIDDNLWGRSSEGKWIEDLDHAPTTTSSSSSRGPSSRRTRPRP
jgi:argininosuccinate synthase